MATVSDKPFQCTFPGCGQKFTNHDHLSTHQQKHDLSLKFRAGEALLIDQTPTPTRFLRNCEESGLFQELEEANPFEQDFETATVTNKKVDGEQPPSSLVDHQGDGVNDGENDSPDSGTHVSAIGTAAIPVAPPPNLVNPDKPVAMASAPAHISTATALTKQKLLQNIQMKEQQKLLEQTIAQQLGSQSPEILAQALKNIIPVADTEPSVQTIDTSPGTFVTPTEIPGRRRGRKPDEEEPEVKRQKFLERNRAAASRCRAKKKVWIENLEKKSKEMEAVNQSLQQEVVMLRSEVQQLKSILIAHKDCPLIVHQTNKEDGEGELRGAEASTGVTLLSQLANMPSMSPLITSPVPSVGSVVPNMGASSGVSVSPATIIITTTNGYTQGTPEVAKDVEISADTDTQSSSEQ